MNHKWLMLILCGMFLTTQGSQAAVDLQDLIKVTGETNVKCVEYYSYHGEMYCSTKALSSSHVDPDSKSFETRNIVFDNRPWQAVWAKKDEVGTTVEYVPMGDDIESWHELVTSQFFPGLQSKTTPKNYADIVLQGIKDAGYKPIVNFIESSDDSVVFEFRIDSPEDQMQDVIQKVTFAKGGIYVLQYAIKKSDMGKKNRDSWLKNLSASTLR